MRPRIAVVEARALKGRAILPCEAFSGLTPALSIARGRLRELSSNAHEDPPLGPRYLAHPFP